MLGLQSYRRCIFCRTHCYHKQYNHEVSLLLNQYCLCKFLLFYIVAFFEMSQTRAMKAVLVPEVYKKLAELYWWQDMFHTWETIKC